MTHQAKPLSIRNVLDNETRSLYQEKLKTHANDPAPDVREVKITNLKIDPSYQKSPKADSVADLAAQWDDRLVTPILVAERGRNLFIVRGVRRAMAAMLRGKDTITARVIKSPGQEYEATMAGHIPQAANDGGKPVRALVKHRQALDNTNHPNHALAVKLQTIVDAVGIKIAEHDAAGVLTGTDRLMNAISLYGDATVERALRIYRKTWTKDRVHAYVASGFAAWLHVYGGVRHLTDDKAANAIRAAFPKHNDLLTANKKLAARRPTDIVYAELLTTHYNNHAEGTGKLRYSRIAEILAP